MRRYIAVAAGLAMVSCATQPPEIVASGPDCRPWKAEVKVACWWPGPGHAVNSCEVANSRPEGCGFEAEAVATLEGSFSIFADETRYPDGTWIWASVYQDEAGRIGRASFRGDRGAILEERKTDTASGFGGHTPLTQSPVDHRDFSLPAETA